MMMCVVSRLMIVYMLIVYMTVMHMIVVYVIVVHVSVVNVSVVHVSVVHVIIVYMVIVHVVIHLFMRKRLVHVSRSFLDSIYEYSHVHAFYSAFFAIFDYIFYFWNTYTV